MRPCSVNRSIVLLLFCTGVIRTLWFCKVRQPSTHSWFVWGCVLWLQKLHNLFLHFQGLEGQRWFESGRPSEALTLDPQKIPWRTKTKIWHAPKPFRAGIPCASLKAVSAKWTKEWRDHYHDRNRGETSYHDGTLEDIRPDHASKSTLSPAERTREFISLDMAIQKENAARCWPQRPHLLVRCYPAAWERIVCLRW